MPSWVHVFITSGPTSRKTTRPPYLLTDRTNPTKTLRPLSPVCPIRDRSTTTSDGLSAIALATESATIALLVPSTNPATLIHLAPGGPAVSETDTLTG